MTLCLSLDAAHHATITTASDHDVALISTRPYPPGATLRGSAPESDLAPYVIKVKACRRQAGSQPAVYEVRGRFVNLTRAQRQQLERSGCRSPVTAP
jgi:hypothetical protein